MTIPTDLFRVDPLTGCNNFLSFAESVDRLALGETKTTKSILYADLNYLKVLNETRGHAYGDSVIRWMGLVLREENDEPAYRVGGDEFATIFTTGTFEEHENVLHKIIARLNKESPPLGIPSPAASIVLIHYNADSQWSPDTVLVQMDRAMEKIKSDGNRDFNIFLEQDLKFDPEAEGKLLANSFQWISQRLFRRFIHMGRLLDEAQQLAYIDSTSELPNMRAALIKLEQTYNNSIASGTPFSILLMDGDNLRLYNNISYVEGDEMINRIGKLLSGKLRPGDFVARWRNGDEFIAVLPNTNSDGAMIVGERFRQSVKEASQSWKFPTSISIGIAVYPIHGDCVNVLIDRAEIAMKNAKDKGKDQVILTDQVYE